MARSTLEDFEILERIGHGSYGVVFRVVRRQDGCVYAMKEIDLEGMSIREQEECIQETRMLSSLDSDYIIKYFDSFLENGKLHIITEYAGSGNLHDHIKKQQRKLPEQVVWKLFIQTLLALQHMHSRRMLHRDVKTLNVFLDQGLNVKLGDLGVAKVLTSTSSFAQSIVGTPYYLSPELCEDRPYNDKSDVWALGVLLYECCTQKHPFDADNQGALILKILRGRYPPLTGYSPDIVDLVKRCLTQDARQRPSASRLLLMPCIRAKALELGLVAAAPRIEPQPEAAGPKAEKRGTQAQAPSQRHVSTTARPSMKPDAAACPPRTSRDAAAFGQRPRDRRAAQAVRQLPTRAPVKRAAGQGVIRLVGDMAKPPARVLPEVHIERVVRAGPAPGPGTSSPRAPAPGGTASSSSSRRPTSPGPTAPEPGTGTLRTMLNHGALPGEGLPEEGLPPDFVPALPALGGLRIHQRLSADKAFVFGAVGSPSESSRGQAASPSASEEPREVEAGDEGVDEEQAAWTMQTWQVVPGDRAAAGEEGQDSSGERQGDALSDGGSGRGGSGGWDDDDEGGGGLGLGQGPSRQQRLQAALEVQKAACLEMVGPDAFLQLYAWLRSSQVDDAGGAEPPCLVGKFLPVDKPEAVQMMCKLLYLEGQLEELE